MKIIHATWEKRNLGVNCHEVVLENNDTLELLKSRSCEFESEYVVIKVPTTMIDISLYLQEAGYQFIETYVSCYHPMTIPKLTKIQERVIDSTTYESMNDKEFEHMLREIKDGMFKGDRISLDPFFTQDQANKRYVGWMQDELKNKSNFYTLKYKNEPVGFFVMKRKGDSYFACLAGIYPSFQRFGFGICLNYFEIIEAISKKSRAVETAFSVNNRGASAIHFSLDYVLKDHYYVYIKHNKI